MLVGLGLVARPRDAIGAAGLALFVGWTVTALCLSLGLVAGLDPNVRSAAFVWVAVVAVSLLVAWRVPRSTVLRPALREASRPGRIVALAGLATLLGYLAALLVRSWEPTGILHADVWYQWLVKAKILYFFGGLDTGTGGFTSQFNPDYPPLHPTSEALVFDATGAANTLELARVHWALAASFLLGAAWLLAPRVRPALLWPSLAMLALAPRFGDLVGSSLADEPLAMLIALAGLAALIWLLDDDWRFAVLAGLFLAAGVATKNEGLMLALVIVAGLAATREGRRRWRGLVGLTSAVVVVQVVWRIWLSHHAVPRNPFYDLSDVFRPVYLLDRTHRLRYGLEELLGQLTTPSRWLLIVPATLVLALLAGRRLPSVSVFVIVVVVLDVLGFAAVYWLSGVDLHFYVDNTVVRLPAFIAMFCGVVFPLLLSVAAEPRDAGSVAEADAK